MMPVILAVHFPAKKLAKLRMAAMLSLIHISEPTRP